jgi:preprotein translocase subunit SecD
MRLLLVAATLFLASFSALAAPAFDAIEIRLVGKGGPKLTVDGTQRVVELGAAPILAAKDFKSAGDIVWVEGQPGFEVTMTEAGSVKLEKFSTENVGKSLAFIVGGKLLMTPTIRDPIAADGFLLTTSGGEDEARELAAIVSRAIDPAPNAAVRGSASSDR